MSCSVKYATESKDSTSSIHTASTLRTEVVCDRLNNKISEVIQSIVADSQKRHDFMKNLELLSRGIFYPHDYLAALKAKKQVRRLDYFLKCDGFYNGYLNPKYFTSVADLSSPSGKKPLSFVLKQGADSVEALQSVRKELSLIGCGEVCQLAQYEAILDIIGVEKFKTLFSADSSTPLMLGSKLNNNPIGRLRTYIMKDNPKPEIMKKGDLLYFKNVDSYSTKHLQGSASGYNVICIDDSDEGHKFTTLGLSPQGLTSSQMNEVLIQDYNSSPFTYLECLSERTKRAFLQTVGPLSMALSEENSQSQISAESFEKQHGGKVTLVCELDAEKITLLANNTIEKARILLDGFKAKIADRQS